MSDSNITPPRVSNRMSPLAIIIAVALVAFVVFAFVKMHGHHTTPTGVVVPTANSAATVMPRQSTVPNTPQAAANTNDSVEAQPDTDKEPGGLAAHSGPANNTGG